MHFASDVLEKEQANVSEGKKNVRNEVAGLKMVKYSESLRNATASIKVKRYINLLFTNL